MTQEQMEAEIAAFVAQLEEKYVHPERFYANGERVGKAHNEHLRHVHTMPRQAPHPEHARVNTRMQIMYALTEAKKRVLDNIKADKPAIEASRVYWHADGSETF